MAAGQRVLVVDDEESVREGCRKILSRGGLEVDAAQNGVEALAKSEAKPYDVVIADWKMPRMGGTDLLRKLLEKDPGTRLIMISGFATLETAVEAMRIGAVDFLAKPFTPEQLEGAVKKAIWVKTEAEAAGKAASELGSDERRAEFDAVLKSYVARPGAVVEAVRKARSIFGVLPAWALRDIASVSGKPYDQLLNLARYMAFTFVEERPRKAEAGDLSWLEEDSYMERVHFSD